MCYGSQLSYIGVLSLLNDRELVLTALLRPTKQN